MGGSMKKLVGFLLVLSVLLAACGSSDNDKTRTTPTDPAPTLPAPPDPAPLPEGTPEAQAAYFIGLLESSDTRLPGWLGLYDALDIPVVEQDGSPVGSTGDDPVGLYFWQVWYASGLDLGGQGLPLSDVGRQMAAILDEADNAAIGPRLLVDLQSAAQSSDPQVRLLGQFVRERVLRGPSHVDILTPGITPEGVVIDLPTVQLIGWVAMRAALLREASPVSPSARPVAAAGRVLRHSQVTRAGSAESTGTTCQDLSNDYTGWANWLLNKFGGGLELPGMTKALPSFTEVIQKKLGVNDSLIKKTSKAAASLNLATTALTSGLQYLAMEYSAIQVPDPLKRTMGDTYDGESGAIGLLVEYDPEKIPNGNELKYCFSSFLANAFGVSFSFPQKGPIPKTEIFVEAGRGIPDLVFFDTNDSAMKVDRVTTGEDGQATIKVLGRHQRRNVPACALPVMKEFSILVSAQPEEAGLSSMASIFFDGLTGSPLSGLMDVLKTLHWKETELVFRVEDWSEVAFCHTASPVAGETDVDRDTSIFITFSEAMDASTITTGTFVLNHGATGEIAYDPVNNLAVFTPSASLKEATTYTATLTTGIKTATGNANAENSTWSFTTENTSPTVTSTSPAAGETNASRLPTIAVTFSEAMDPATIATEVLTVSSGAAAIFAYYHPTTNTAEFTLPSSLARSTTYTATVAKEVKDVKGNAMENDHSWTFTTGDGDPITAFWFESPAATGAIDQDAKTIEVTVPYGTDLTALVASFTTTGITVEVGTNEQVSGTTINNFTSTIFYKVIAENGSSEIYSVAVIKPPARFTDNGDGTITDNKSNLAWVKTISSEEVAWATCIDYCAGLGVSNFAGHSDWTVPSTQALTGLIYERSGWEPKYFLEYNGFVNVLYEYYWTSTYTESVNNQNVVYTVADRIEMQSGSWGSALSTHKENCGFCVSGGN